MSENQEILFNRFRIEECLKKDRISNVYIAWHIHLEKKILLKTLNTEEIEDQGWLERFRREAKVLARLDHPNIIRVLDFGSDKKVYYISFEYFNGRNLRQLLSEEPPDHEQKKHILIQLLQGLEAAHQHGIIHRDVKPENILVNNEWYLKLVDFGLAFRAEDPKLTSKSSLIGTPAYMSPEQIRGENLNAQTDLFSAGIVAFEMFQGYHPFLGEDIKDTINNILNIDHQRISGKLASEVPPVIMELLQISPQQRPSSAAQSLKELGIKPDVNRIDHLPILKQQKNYMRLALISFVIILLGLSGYIFYPDINKLLTGEKPLAHTNPPADTTLQVSTMSMQEKLPDRSELIKEQVEENPDLPELGTLFVFSDPVTEVYIDRHYHGKTPFRAPLELSTGTHSLKLSHELYPDHYQEIKIDAGRAQILGFALDTLFGYLSCQVYPWGMVLVDGKLIGETPLAEPVLLAPGSYKITIENPGFQTFTDSLVITKQETTALKVNLEKRTKLQ